MIRIDELYCNTFLPGLQHRPNHGLHWFDPFGSVKYEDICSVPPVINNARAVRYLFLDQEPISGPIVEDTLRKFTELFSEGERHLITSEFQSENTEHIVNTYGFIPHYYFFHGWAALDWFRGYDRSFLMKPPEARQINKTFIAPNRIVAGERQHRLYMLYHIFRLGMTDNWLSCPEVCPGENIRLLDAVKPLAKIYPDIEQVFEKQSLPINFPNETGHPMNSAWLNLFDESADSLLYLVTETVATGRRQHLTEKTFKPIALRMPFVVVGCAGSLKYLRSYGFKTFGDLWDESYDDETDDVRRYEKIAKTLKELDDLSQTEKQNLFDRARNICQHNYNHFYYGDFESILWTELTNMIDEL